MKTHALDSIHQGGRLHGKQSQRLSDVDAGYWNPDHQQPYCPVPKERSQGRKAAAKQLARIMRRRAQVQPCDPAPKEHSSPAAGYQGESIVKRFPCTIKDKTTGDEIDILAKLKLNYVDVCCYGEQFFLRKSEKGSRVYDSRSDTRISPEFAKSELVRLLGLRDGIAAYASLMA